MRGTVKWFNARRGFGFITAEDGTDYFVHQSEIRMDGFRRLRDQQQVSFSQSTDEQGRAVATEVVPEA